MHQMLIPQLLFPFPGELLLSHDGNSRLISRCCPELSLRPLQQRAAAQPQRQLPSSLHDPEPGPDPVPRAYWQGRQPGRLCAANRHKQHTFAEPASLLELGVVR